MLGNIQLLYSILLSLAAYSGTADTPSQPTGTISPTGGASAESTPVQQTKPTEQTDPTKSQAVIDVENLISAIGEIVRGGEGEPDSLTAIIAAEEAYNALSPEDKTSVENVDILTAARAAYEQLGYEQAADAIETQITAVSSRGDALEAIRAYNAAGKEVQALVENVDTLRTSAHSYADKMLKNLKADEDFVRGYTFYYPSAFPWGENYWYADQGCFILPYMGTDSKGDVWLRLICNYNSYDWIFFDKITYAADSERFYDYFKKYDVVRDNSGGEVWEYIDIDAGKTEIEMLWAVANSKKTIVRFEGDDHYYDYTVTSKQKNSIRTMMTVYELLSF